MEQWHKDGKVFNSYYAIRQDSEASLPEVLNDAILAENGYVPIVEVRPIYNESTEYLVEGMVELLNSVPTLTYTINQKTQEQVSAYMSSVVQHFTDTTTTYIEVKVAEYNIANGLAFKDIDAFTKYAVTPTSIHNAIAIRFIGYADRLWTAVRTYQATATSIPTDAEFKAILDGVVF